MLGSLSLKSKIAITILVIVVSFAFGRFTGPEKVKIETKIVEVEKKTDEKSSEREKRTHKETTETEITRPDGTKEKTTKTTEDTDTSSSKSSKNSSESSKASESSKEVVRGGSAVTVSALVGYDVRTATGYDYGASVSKQFLGPISVGIFGFQSGRVGLQVGVSF